MMQSGGPLQGICPADAHQFGPHRGEVEVHIVRHEPVCVPYGLWICVPYGLWKRRKHSWAGTPRYRAPSPSNTRRSRNACANGDSWTAA
jgi:hypothetical protein